MTSGVTGEPGIFVHDDNAVVVYRALTLVRGWLAWMTPTCLWGRLRQGDRVAPVVTTGGHYGSPGMAEVARRHRLWPFNRVRVFSAGRPVAELVRDLNAFQPAELNGYSSALSPAPAIPTSMTACRSLGWMRRTASARKPRKLNPTWGCGSLPRTTLTALAVVVLPKEPTTATTRVFRARVRRWTITRRESNGQARKP